MQETQRRILVVDTEDGQAGKLVSRSLRSATDMSVTTITVDQYLSGIPNGFNLVILPLFGVSHEGMGKAVGLNLIQLTKARNPEQAVMLLSAALNLGIAMYATRTLGAEMIIPKQLIFERGIDWFIERVREQLH